MAPVRRTRSPEDSDDDDEGASSGAEQKPVVNKRPRLSAQGRDENGSPAPVAADFRPSPTPFAPTQRLGIREYEAVRADMDALSDGAEDLAEAEAAILDPMIDALRHNNNILRENRIAENGILESVSCINFMCHKNLVFKLGPLINFIIGHNGSGKSAVLTALQLCLGGKATHTNRGNNLKSFVKEGEESSTLIVKIKNGGNGSYKYDLYGDSIIVERHFNVHGASSFKLKSAAGKIVSTKKADLDDINDFYALQLDNPMNVLTQDAARQFLNASSSTEKYKFFIKGVQLEALDQDYMMLASRLDQMQPRIDAAEEDCQAQKQRYREAENKVKIHNRSRGLREEFERMSKQMIWAQVGDQEDLHAKHVQEMNQAEEKVSEAEQQVEAVSERFERAERKREDLQTAMTLHQQELAPDIEERDRLKAKCDQKDADMSFSRSEERQIQDQVKGIQTEVRKLENDIEAEYQRLTAADGGSNEEKLEQIHALQTQLQELAAQREEGNRKIPELDREIHKAELEANEAGEKLKQATAEVSTAQRRLGDLERNRGDPDAPFHPNLKRVRQAIARETRWTDKPLGPMGSYIKLKKPEWAHAMERVFGANLNGFVCSNRHDQILLKDIFRSCEYTQPILTSNRNNLTLNEPDPALDTPLRVLEFDDVLVKNASIINHTIDKTILVGNREELSRLMYDQRGRPQNVQAGIAHHDDDRRSSIRYAYGLRGSAKQDSMVPFQGALRIRTSIENQVQDAQDAINRARDEKALAENGRRAAQEKVAQAKAAGRRHKTQLDQLKREMNNAEDEVARLEREMAEAAPQAGKLDDLKTQLEEAKESMRSYKAQADNQMALSRTKHAEKVQLEEQVAAADAQIKTASGKSQKLQERINNASKAITLAQRDLDKARHHKTQAEGVVASCRDECNAQAAEVARFEEQARQLCPERVEIPPGETSNSLDRKMQRMNEDILAVSRQAGGTLEEVMAKYNQEKEAFHAVYASIKEIKADMDRIQTTLAVRQRRWGQFRRAISARARNHFIYLLSERSYTGRIHLDHRTKTLDLTVQPDMTEALRRRGGEPNERQTKTLSGGEKSFSTICLLLSLWDAMGSPIRCLDEFDVFMDSVNRDASMKMMIAAARRSVSRQYILISPQAMGGVDLNGHDDVKVLRMPDPVRAGQRTLESVGVVVG